MTWHRATPCCGPEPVLCNLPCITYKWCSADQEGDTDDSDFTCRYFALCQHPDGKFCFKSRADSLLLAIGVIPCNGVFAPWFPNSFENNANTERNKTASFSRVKFRVIRGRPSDIEVDSSMSRRF
jgi:hypothetical protein